MNNYNLFTKQSDQALTDLADQCVKCGLCIPKCPTYQIFQQEPESPRGRIAIIDGLVNGKISANDKAAADYLNHCTTCYTCEAVCPAKVDYGTLIANARSQLITGQQLSLNKRFGLWLLTKSNLLNIVFTSIRLLQKIKILEILYQLKILTLLKLNRYYQLLPKLSASRELPHKSSNQTEKITLFAGCLAPFLDAKTLADTAQLLTQLGVQVTVENQHNCCGALHYHVGQLETAKKQADKIIDGFKKNSTKTCISTTSGCAAHLEKLKDYDQNFSHGFIIAYLDKLLKTQTAKFKPLKQKILLHHPCAERNGLKQHKITQSLLQSIPELELINFPESISCCGAAGSYFLEYPDQARKIRNPLLDVIITEEPAMIISTNFGCLLHLQQGLQELDIEVEMLHPVSLLLKQLDSEGHHA